MRVAIIKGSTVENVVLMAEDAELTSNQIALKNGESAGKGWTLASDGTFVAPIKTLPTLTPEEKVAEFEARIEAHVNSVARAKGYNNIDSIAKYLVEGNPFKAEAESLSIWTANVWVSAHIMLNDWQNGGEEPTIDEVIAALPPAP